MKKLFSTLRRLFKRKVKGFNSHVKYREIYPPGMDKHIDDLFIKSDRDILNNKGNGDFYLGLLMDRNIDN